MKGKCLKTALFMSCCSSSMLAQTNSILNDTTLLNEAQVTAVRATANTPIAFTNINKSQIDAVNFGQDIPFILGFMPSVLTTSDAGTGIGYTSMRIRGTDGTRINVTNNGIPLNDAESHTFFWVDLPDFASGVEDIQVQRGLGTSTNGAAAFGGSVNMRTEQIRKTSYAEFNSSYGSFNSNKETLKFGTGLIGGHWSFDGRLSHIGSDGYRDRASTGMEGYSAQLGYTINNTVMKLIAFGGKETTYHAWDGISKKQLTTERRYNPNGAIEDDKGNIVGFYKDQNDVFKQNHYQFIITSKLSPKLELNAAAHYTYGKGYYEQYKNRRKFANFALTPFTDAATGETVKRSNLINRKYNKGDFGGITSSIHYRNKQFALISGVAGNHFVNDHYGVVEWVKNYVGDLTPQHEYYRNTGRKTDVSAFARAEWKVVRARLSLFADVQYRHIHYSIRGINDDDGLSPINVSENFNFLNPKFGATWRAHRNAKVYASVSVGHKEPVRNNYTDGYLAGQELPRPERMIDYELGYRYETSKLSAGLNFYYMHYRDQLVNTGRVNAIGEAVVENVPSSYRAGVELEAAWQILPVLKWEANATLSRNRIKNYVTYLFDENWENLRSFNLGNSPIGFTPSIMANNRFTFTHKGFAATLTSQFVSRQYLDNMGRRESSLDAYFVNHLNLSYSIYPSVLKKLTFSLAVYNLFNEKYETNGYSQTVYSKQSDGTMSFAYDPRFYPMAGTNVMAGVNICF